MYLKELTLRGFKSFASATTLRFEPGITAVIGPNGSGKSNIVDALAWVMGEQGAKALRGTQMEDVIFAGTSSRPPLGRAQVSLTIDNSDHTLDIDYSEVTISRTIFRNGGSEYAINGSQCRLLDIQELLSDTGLGQQMHVIVGQGRLDAILRADPAGHRAFIEEAAGILKHRKRKERALRKLANTERNLSRLDDLLGEIHRQLGPLGRQARISRRAEAIQVTLRDAQSRLYAQDAVEAADRLETVRGQLAEVRSRLSAAQQSLAGVKVRIEQVESLVSRSSPAIASIGEIWHRYAQLQERYRSLAQLARERARSASDQIVASVGENPELLAKRAEELDAQARGQQNTVRDARLALDKAIERRADEERNLASVRQTLTELRKTEQRRESQMAELTAMIAREEAAVELAATRARDLESQRDSLSRQLAEATEQHDALERETESFGDDGGQALDQARTALADRQEALNALLDKQRTVNSRIISLKAKADALNDTLESRNASGALERDSHVAALGRLADFIHVEDGWEEAVAHALDVFAGAMVVPDDSAMMRALERAKTDKLGKAVVLVPRDDAESGGAPASFGIADDTADSVGHDMDGLRRDTRPLGTLVHPNPAADARQSAGVVASVRVLLADVAAVASLDEARLVLRDEGHPWMQAVTRDGEVLNRVAAVGGSSLSQSDLSLAARRDKALAQVESLSSELASIDDDVAGAQAKRDEGRLAVERESQKRTEARLKVQQAEKSLKSAADRMTGFTRQIKGLDGKLASMGQDRQAHQLKLDELTRTLESARRSDGEQVGFDELETRQKTLESSLGIARDHEMSMKLAWSEASRKADSLKRQAELLRDQAHEAEERRMRIESLNAKHRDQAARAERIAADAGDIADLITRYIEAAARRRDELQAQASGHDDELKALRAERDRIEPQVAELTAREHALDVDRERVAGRYGQITQKVSDDLGLAMGELIDRYGPDVPVPVLDEHGQPVPLDGDGSDDADADTSTWRTVPYDRVEQTKRLNRARRDLAALGKVNPLAGEEYDALQARNKYLNDQRNDVVRSRDDLMGLVKDLDDTMVSVFKSAFEDTAAAFEKMFALLFPGGRGRLRLENPDDLLTTGVLVEARPAGKRVKQLTLLSGGERSLTALALLFAIFTARPSPFYVMDEVEAALDDVNLTRLINALNTLREHAQLIVITHQQRTMSIADALYGVTMRADGVTTVVSQRLSD